MLAHTYEDVLDARVMLTDSGRLAGPRRGADENAPRSRRMNALAAWSMRPIETCRRRAAERLRHAALFTSARIETPWTPTTAYGQTLPRSSRARRIEGVPTKPNRSVYQTERHLLYVSCTGARDRLTISKTMNSARRRFMIHGTPVRSSNSSSSSAFSSSHETDGKCASCTMSASKIRAAASPRAASAKVRPARDAPRQFRGGCWR